MADKRTFVCLLRGINVGGHNRIKMADLRAMLTALGFADVRTYIQSGNIVFSASGVDERAAEAKISAAFDKHMGFVPRVLVIDGPTFSVAAADCPYANAAAANPKFVHAYFLAERPSDDALSALRAVETTTDEWVFEHGIVFVHTPLGLLKSKTIPVLERRLKVAATGRNWRSVLAIDALVRA